MPAIKLWRSLASLVVVLTVFSRHVSAAPACDDDRAAVEVSAIRARLVEESASAERWNLVWQVGFGAAAVGELAVAVAQWNPFGDFTRTDRDTLYVGTAKASIGALARLITPLRIEIPATQASPCADLAALRDAVADNARRERAMFWTSHVGGLAVSLGGFVVLGEETNWTAAALSFAVSYPIGLLSTYTMPRGSWHAWASIRATTIVPVPIAGGGAGVMLGGTF